jgi:hypothetical protein
MENTASTRLLKRGDIIVCITRDWERFTYGKKYEVLMDQIGNVIDVANDQGLRLEIFRNFGRMALHEDRRIDKAGRLTGFSYFLTMKNHPDVDCPLISSSTSFTSSFP